MGLLRNRCVAGAVIKRGENDLPGAEALNNLVLAGVAFYEMDDQSQPRFFVRSHGPISIYDRFVELVRAQLSV